MANRRALTVIQLLPALETGGVERSTVEIAAALVAAGHRAIVVSAGGRLIHALQSRGAEHIKHDIGRKSLLTLRHAGTLARLFEREQPDIVHARSRLPAWLAWFALQRIRGLRPHFVTTVHGLNSPGRYSTIMTRGERVVCVSQTVRRHLLRHYPGVEAERLTVIPRGIDPDEFPRGYSLPAGWREEIEKSFPPLAGRQWLLLPGRGTRLKGQRTALELLAALAAHGHNVALALLGAVQPGRESYLVELTKIAGGLGMANRVVLLPAQQNMKAWYAASSLVLQLSERPEAFGRTVVEALHIGTPVLGWDHGGAGELLSELYPAGRVPFSDKAVLLSQAAYLLNEPPPVAPVTGYALAAMQDATLALYHGLAGYPHD